MVPLQHFDSTKIFHSCFLSSVHNFPCAFFILCGSTIQVYVHKTMYLYLLTCISLVFPTFCFFFHKCLIIPFSECNFQCLKMTHFLLEETPPRRGRDAFWLKRLKVYLNVLGFKMWKTFFFYRNLNAEVKPRIHQTNICSISIMEKWIRKE